MRQLVLAAALVFAVSADAMPMFVALGDLPAGTFGSQATAVSADGSTVVGTGRSAFGDEAFRWTLAGGMVGLGTLPGGSVGSGSRATAVSSDGSVVVGDSYAIYGDALEGGEAFRWTADGGMVGLRDLRYPGPFLLQSAATGVSADGSVVVGNSQSNSAVGFNDEAFRWTADGGMVGLGFLPAGGGFGGTATGVSADGSFVVGWDCCPLGSEAFRWTADIGMVRPRHGWQ
jgi:probable HAF family extracellular repeat protein